MIGSAKYRTRQPTSSQETMKSTPTVEMETITGPHPLDDRNDFQLLNQAAKFKRLQDEAELVPANKGETEEGEFHSPEQNT